MKVLLFLAFFFAAVNAVPEEKDRENGENGWYVPQLEGGFEWMSLDEAQRMLNVVNRTEVSTYSSSLVDLVPVNFHLYTSSNPTKSSVIKTTKSSVDASHFNASNPTRFVIHGWIQNHNHETLVDIRKSWLSLGDYNIIEVNWPRSISVSYLSSVVAVSRVGAKVANLIDFLNANYGMSFDDLIVIGHSLGAHVAGHTGKNVQRGKVNTIVGLDPALPLFFYNRPQDRLSSDDAVYVETIQTNGGTLGFLKPIGQTVFYPNGGKQQPGCILDLAGMCSHQRSVIYYAEAVRMNSFVAAKCSNYEDAVENTCSTQYSNARMGALSNANLVPGIYYVPVHSTSPYGYGAKN